MTQDIKALILAAARIAGDANGGDDWDAVVKASKVDAGIAELLVSGLPGRQELGSLSPYITVSYGRWHFTDAGQAIALNFRPR